jgi:hypothetical protein
MRSKPNARRTVGQQLNMCFDTSVWYRKAIGSRLSQPMVEVFTQWSGIPLGELKGHLHAVVSWPEHPTLN